MNEKKNKDIQESGSREAVILAYRGQIEGKRLFPRFGNVTLAKEARFKVFNPRMGWEGVVEWREI